MVKWSPHKASVVATEHITIGSTVAGFGSLGFLDRWPWIICLSLVLNGHHMFNIRWCQCIAEMCQHERDGIWSLRCDENLFFGIWVQVKLKMFYKYKNSPSLLPIPSAVRRARGPCKTVIAHWSLSSMKRRHLELWKFQRRGQRFRGQQKGTHERVDCKVCPIL